MINETLNDNEKAILNAIRILNLKNAKVILQVLLIVLTTKMDLLFMKDNFYQTHLKQKL